MKQIKKLFSMKVALVLLGLMVAACIVGSVIPQGEIDAYYTGYYSQKVGMFLLLAGLNDVFHAWWFVTITALLCLNLLGCNLIHFPRLVRQLKNGFRPESFPAERAGEPVTQVREPQKLLQALGFRNIRAGEQGDRKILYAVRNRAGIWGAWLTHLGMLVIILGFALGQIYTVKYTVYGVPGQTKPVGDTRYTLTIEDFRVDLRADETVEQYTSRLTLTDPDRSLAAQGDTSVNHPMSAMGMKLYQNSTGWAARVQIWKGETLLQDEILCAGEHLAVKGLEDLVLSYRAFYPDYTTDAQGMPTTASSQVRNPAYLYALYYQEGVLGMNVLKGDERISVNDYSFIFSEPQQYTLIQVKHDPFTWLAGIGGIVMMLALILAFYIRVEEVLAVETPSGTWEIYGRSRKGGILFRERILEKARQTEQGGNP